LLPQSPVRLSPHTSSVAGPASPLSFDHFSGYAWGDRYVHEYSLLGFWGSGSPFAGFLGVGVCPGCESGGASAGHDTLFSGLRFKDDTGISRCQYRTRLWRDDSLPETGVDLTATPGVQSMRFELSEPTSLFLDTYSTLREGGVASASFNTTSCTGWIQAKRCDAYRFSFALSHCSLAPDSPTTPTLNHPFVFTPTSSLTVTVSFASVDAAKTLLAAEIAQSTTTLLDTCGTAWSTVLTSALTLDPPPPPTLDATFASAFLEPANYTDAVTGTYPGFDGKPHKSVAGVSGHMGDLSLWDIHRSQIPLLSLLHPQLYKDIVHSLLADASHTSPAHTMPKWVLGPCDTGSMDGHFAVVVVTDAVAKGVLTPTPAILDTLVRSANAVDSSYLLHGFFDGDRVSGAASKTLDAAYIDGCVAAVARALGNSTVAAEFGTRAHNYRQVWHSTRLLACPRSLSTGKLVCPADPNDIWGQIILGNKEGYVECNAAQQRWHVPLALEELATTLFGSATRFGDTLAEFVSNSSLFPSNVLPNPYYWAGNEPDLLAPWLLSVVNRPNDTIALTRAVAAARFSPHPDGVPGNDDGGTMSSWHVLSQLGIYPVTGTDTWLTSGLNARSAHLPRWNVTLTAVGDYASGHLLSLTVNGRSPARPTFFDAAPSSSFVLSHTDLTTPGNTITFTYVSSTSVP
jgi:putative alpha-1,2-mannosidase